MTEEILIYFCVHCARALRISYATIKSYLCGIRSIYIEKGHGDPLISPTGLAYGRLQMVLRRIRKSQVTVPKTRLPITVDILRSLCSFLQAGCFGRHTDCMIQAEGPVSIFSSKF